MLNKLKLTIQYASLFIKTDERLAFFYVIKNLRKELKMVTMVGTQSNFFNAIKELVELEFDMFETYEYALSKIQDENYAKHLIEFKADHARHIKELSALLAEQNVKAPTGPDHTKQWIAKGKVALANLVSQEAILSAMNSNEADSNIAYSRLLSREDMPLQWRQIFQRAFEDEKRHKAWFEAELAKE